MNKTPTGRDWLIEAIESSLIPQLKAHGFAHLPLSGDDAKSPEIRHAFPFGRFRRNNQSAFEQVEIQLDKHGSAAFRLNLGVIPSGGVDHFAGHVTAEDAWVQYLQESGEVCNGRRWFQPWTWPWSKPTRKQFDDLVTRVSQMIPEAEAFFRSSKATDHIRVIRR